MLSWVFFAILTALLAGTASVVQKKALFKEHALEFATIFSIFTALITLPALFIYDLSAITGTIFSYILLTSILSAAAFLLTVKAMRHLPISLASPLLVFLPALSAILAFAFLGETLTLLQVSGIIVIVIGAYLLESHHHEPWYAPLQHALKQRHVKYVLAALLIYGFLSIIDRKVLAPSSIGGLDVAPALYLALVQLIVAIIYIVMLIFFHDGVVGIKHGLKEAGPMIFLVAILAVGYRFTGALALSFAAGKVALFVGVKRMSALFATVIGGSLFHEKNLERRAVACGVMVIGAALILI